MKVSKITSLPLLLAALLKALVPTASNNPTKDRQKKGSIPSGIDPTISYFSMPARTQQLHTDFAFSGAGISGFAVRQTYWL